MSKRKTLNDDTLADEWWPREGRRLILAWRPSSRSHVFFGRVFLILQTPGRRLTPCNFHFRRFKSSKRKKKFENLHNILPEWCLAAFRQLLTFRRFTRLWTSSRHWPISRRLARCLFSLLNVETLAAPCAVIRTLFIDCAFPHFGRPSSIRLDCTSPLVVQLINQRL